MLAARDHLHWYVWAWIIFAGVSMVKNVYCSLPIIRDGCMSILSYIIMSRAHDSHISTYFQCFFTLLVVLFIEVTWPSNSLACYLLPNHAHFSCCSLIAPTFSVGHFVSAKLYCGIINQDSTLVVYCNGRCYFTSNTAV